MAVADQMVKVRSKSKIDQHAGVWLLKAGQEQAIPVTLLPTFAAYVDVVPEAVPTTNSLTVFRGGPGGEPDSGCNATCGHSLCILTRGLIRALRTQGYEVDRQAWRLDLDQSVIGETRLCNSGSFEGPRGRFSWPHPDADRCPRRHAEYLRDHFDGHICSSQAVKDSLVAAGLAADHCHVVNDAIDVDLYRPEGSVADIGGDRFMFLMLGALNPRKGFDVALEAYGRAFKADDPVVLVLKDYDYGWGRRGWCQQMLEEWRKRLGDQAPAVEYVYETWEQEKIAAAYRRAAQHGAYLMPSRAEGFGLTALEALACGCRIGVTGWGGHLDYASQQNATLFGYQMVPVTINPNYWEADERPQWANPKLEEVVAWMRRICKEPPDRIAQGYRAHEMRQQFCYERAAGELAAALGLKQNDGRGPGAESTVRHCPVPGRVSVTPITADETIGIGIPTRDRPIYLAMLLAGLLAQTRRPQAICIVNDGSPELGKDPAVKHIISLWQTAGVRCEIVRGTGRGASPNHQVAMEVLGTDLVLRIDDDMVPGAADFVDRLYRLLNRRPEVGAVGGVYPLWHDAVEHNYAEMAGRPGMTNRIDDLLAGKVNLQFWRYSDEAVVESEHLYSTWMYRRRYLEEVGGFPDCYSRFGQREETDGSVRLHLLGGLRLLVDVRAVAWHFLAQGGRRPEGSRKVAEEDDKLFRERLARWRQAIVAASRH